MPESKVIDHNGFVIDAIPPRLGELRPVSEYKAAPVRITGLDPLTGKTITVVANRIASGPDGKPFQFAEKPGASRVARRTSPNITARELDDYGDDLSAMTEAAILRTRKGAS